MATDTKDARMPPAASRYCYCVCDKKRRKHPGVRLQLFPKDARRDTNKKPPTKHHLQAAYANTAMGREAVRTPHQLIATAANFLAPEQRGDSSSCHHVMGRTE
ncbi:hypothetical protein GWK47_034164 [Chionoecetes opilio]|uniref:Uncharacterized protein n=1 Tax=Chionoecetes opilio TaxID=41210 RepID=A0A8J5D015_CHIOP|nr:hypothetical protein GWK47_034164 [Chionoecetes opilio]